MAVVSISLPDALLVQADRTIQSRGFSGRSELVRAAVREFLSHGVPPHRSGACSATLTLVYPEGAEKEFSRIRHAFGDTVRTLVHGHAHEGCLEVFILEGKADRIQGFADALRGARHATQVSLTFTHHRKTDDSKGAPGT